MNLTITMNDWGSRALEFAWPVLWQSSLLIGLVWMLDGALRRRVRAAVRYALWLVVLLKLVLPPALALPTGLGWWVRGAQARPAPQRPAAVVVTYGAQQQSVAPAVGDLPTSVWVAPPAPRLSASAWALAGSVAVSSSISCTEELKRRCSLCAAVSKKLAKPCQLPGKCRRPLILLGF